MYIHVYKLGGVNVPDKLYVFHANKVETASCPGIAGLSSPTMSVLCTYMYIHVHVNYLFNVHVNYLFTAYLHQ